MICMNCGRELADSAAFCKYCGTKTQQTTGNYAPPQQTRQASYAPPPAGHRQLYCTPADPAGQLRPPQQTTGNYTVPQQPQQAYYAASAVAPTEAPAETPAAPAKSKTAKKKSFNPLLIVTIVAIIAVIVLACILLFGGSDQDSASGAEPSTVESTLSGASAVASEQPPVAAEQQPTATEQPLPTNAVAVPAQGTPAEPGTEQAVTVDSAGTSLKGYTLTEVGSFTADSDWMWVQYNIMVDTGSSAPVVYFPNGSRLEGIYTCVDLGGGYCGLGNSESEMNSLALFTAEGEQLTPFEAADIEWLESQDYFPDGTFASEYRYLRVTYTTGTTTNEDECFIEDYNTDTMYTGYAKVYDLRENRFVPNVEITNPSSYDSVICGDHFAVEDEDGVLFLYDSDGNVIMQTARSSAYDVGYGYLITYDSGSYDVYDETGALRYSSANSLYVLPSTSGYLREYRDGEYAVLDIDGNQVLANTYDYITGECQGIFRVETAAGMNQLVTADGTVLAESANSFYTDVLGYYYCDEGTYSLYGLDGLIAKDLEDYPYELCIMDGTTGLVINDKTFSLALDDDYVYSLAPGLGSATSDATGKYGCFDFFTGQQLLDYAYNDIDATDTHVYARQGDTWHVFEIVPIYG